MRRMYSKQELNNVVKSFVANGGLDGVDVKVKSLTSSGDIIEIMSGYSYDKTGVKPSLNYVSVAKTGNKITFAISGVYTRKTADGSNLSLGIFTVPEAIADKLYPNSLGALANVNLALFNSTTANTSLPARMSKSLDKTLAVTLYNAYTLTEDTSYEFRLEITFLLSDNLVSEE